MKSLRPDKKNRWLEPNAKKFFVASLIYFGLGLVMQTIAVFDVWLGFNPISYTTATAIKELLLAGWLTQLALALIYDRWLKATNPKRATLIFGLFNTGLPLVIIGQPGLLIFGTIWLGAAAAFGAVLQLLAGIIFLGDVWQSYQSNI